MFRIFSHIGLLCAFVCLFAASAHSGFGNSPHARRPHGGPHPRLAPARNKSRAQIACLYITRYDPNCSKNPAGVVGKGTPTSFAVDPSMPFSLLVHRLVPIAKSLSLVTVRFYDIGYSQGQPELTPSQIMKPADGQFNLEKGEEKIQVLLSQQTADAARPVLVVVSARSENKEPVYVSGLLTVTPK